MNNLAYPMEEVESNEDLSADLACEIERHSLVLIPLQHLQQIYA